MTNEPERFKKKGHKKKGKHLLSHRYNPLPLLRSHPGGVQEELVVKDLPRHKDTKICILSIKNNILSTLSS